MKIREVIIACLVFAAIAGVFFYKFSLFGRIPFPGDLLIAEYKPWRTYSYLGYNPGSYPHKAQYFDTLRQLYPWKTFTITMLKEKTLPLWNPYNFSGSPLLANSQSAVLYPLNIIYFILNQPAAWAILVFLQPFLASLGTYLFCRSIKMGPRGAFLAGVTYGYSMFMITFLEYNSIGQVALWLPFLLYALERVNVTLVVFSAGAAALAGHLQIFVYVMLFAGAYFFVRLRERNKRLSIKTTLFLLFPFAFSAVQLFPTTELIRLSARAPQEYAFLVNKLLLAPYQLALFLSADLFGNPASHNFLLKDSYPGNAIYIGIIPLLFTLLALRIWKKNVYTKFFALASVIILILIVRSPVTELIYRIPLPFFSTASPTNAIFLLSFSLAVLAGLGLEAWVTKTQKKTKTIIAGATGAFLLLWVASWIDPDIISRKNLLYSTGLFVLSAGLLLVGTARKKLKAYILFTLVLLAIVDSWYFFQKFNPFVPRELVFPEAKVLTWLTENAGIDRFWGIGNAQIEANFATQYGVYSPDGYDPLYPKTYGEFIGAAGDGKLRTVFDNRTRSDAVIPGSNIALLDNPARKKVLDTLGVRYILDRAENANTQKELPPGEFKLLYESDGWKIFENAKSLPRAVMVSDYKIYNDAAEFERMFFDASFDPKKTVLLPQKPDIGLTTSKPGEATIISYKPNTVVIRTTAESDQLLVLSDTFFPGWKATVDGNSTEILVANWTFRAVVVPKGSHSVTFDYKPASFSMGLKTTMISLLLFAGWSIWDKKKHL